MAASVRVVSNRLPAIAASLRPKASQIVRKTAEDIAAQAKLNTPPRVDTGAMMNGYQIEMRGELSAVVFNTQEYHIHQELGTAHISPHPMLVPAAEKARAPFQAAINQLVSF